MTKKRKPINNTNIPQYAIDRLARCFYPDIVAFYETEEGKHILQELKQQTDVQSSISSHGNYLDDKAAFSGKQQAK